MSKCKYRKNINLIFFYLYYQSIFFHFFYPQLPLPSATYFLCLPSPKVLFAATLKRK